MLNILRSIPGITKSSLVHMRREVFISKTLCRHVKKAAFCIWRTGKRPFNISLIFNYCKPRSFYFSMLRLRLTLFPLFFAIRTADFSVCCP